MHCAKDSRSTCFPCDQWLRSDNRGVATSVELFAQAQAGPVQYYIQVKTSDKSAVSAANVVLLLDIYGATGKVGPLMLHNSAAFKAGQLDAFKVTVTGVGAISHVRLAFDESSNRAAWLGESLEVTMRPPGGGAEQHYFFKVRRPLDEFAGAMMELKPSDNPPPATSKVVAPYTIKVYCCQLSLFCKATGP